MSLDLKIDRYFSKNVEMVYLLLVKMNSSHRKICNIQYLLFFSVWHSYRAPSISDLFFFIQDGAENSVLPNIYRFSCKIHTIEVTRRNM